MASSASNGRSTPTSPVRKGKRLWLVLASISIGWKVLVFTLGVAVPRWVIGDGLDAVPAEARMYAQQAKVTALGLWNHPLERLGIVQALRVIRVDRVSSGKGGTTDGCHDRRVVVRAYTYFAIPYSEAKTTCDTGTVEYRVFRGDS